MCKRVCLCVSCAFSLTFLFACLFKFYLSGDFLCMGVYLQVCLVATEVEESTVSPGTGVIDEL